MFVPEIRVECRPPESRGSAGGVGVSCERWFKSPLGDELAPPDAVGARVCWLWPLLAQSAVGALSEAFLHRAVPA